MEKYESESRKISFETQDMSFEAQDMSFETQSNLLSEISIVDYRERLESEGSEADEPEFFEETEFFDESKNPKSEFPNEAYKDLMLLVTNNKLNNKAGNAIIRFFNKHSNLPKSPLPKNIEKGREFMNKMEYPNLTFNKISIKHYNGNEYFLHYQNLIHCIKNIMEVPGITDNFALSYENYQVSRFTRYLLNHLIKHYLNYPIKLYIYLTYSIREKMCIKNKTMGYGGRIQKHHYPLGQNYYQLSYIRMQLPQIHLEKISYILFIYQLETFLLGDATNRILNNFWVTYLY